MLLSKSPFRRYGASMHSEDAKKRERLHCYVMGFVDLFNSPRRPEFGQPYYPRPMARGDACGSEYRHVSQTGYHCFINPPENKRGIANNKYPCPDHDRSGYVATEFPENWQKSGCYR